MNHLLLMFFIMMALHLFVMPFAMIASPSDYRLSLTQFYGAVFMSSAMIACMGMFSGLDTLEWLVVAVLLTISLVALRFQFGVTDREYINDMIPHHSMAVLTSSARLNATGDPSVRKLAAGILDTQTQEIAFMKSLNLDR